MMLPELCIRRPVLASMMSLALIIFGVVALDRLAVRELPDIDPPIVNVTTVYRGANANVVETEVTERLEEVINGVEGIKTLTSDSREELSQITIEFTLARDIDLAAQDVRDRVARVRTALPDDVDDPVVAKQDSDARPMLWVALYSSRYTTQQLTEIGEEYLKDSFQTVQGVSSVIFGGEKRFAIRVRLDANKMAAHGVTVTDVERALREENVELPSGRVENLQREFIIQTLGELKTVEQFTRLVVRQEGDRVVRIGDIGVVQEGVEDERSVARYRSQPAVGLGIVKQAKANTIEVAQGIKKEIERQSHAIPEGIEMFVAYDESVFVEDAISQVWYSLGLAFLLVVVTIYAFLRDWRSTLIPSLTIPIATISTFTVLWMMGFSVNILTMLGLVLAIGIVVDDSIVVLENIYRHIESGLSPFDAAIKGMREITFAVIATTVALIAVFLPLSFQTTITGRLFIEFAIALSGAVIISTFIALTLTPMACSKLLRPISESDDTHKWLQSFETFLVMLTDRYESLLRRAFNYRRLVLGASLLFVAVGSVCYIFLDKEFLPEEDKGRLFCLAIAPEGSTSEYTDQVVRKMEDIVKSIPEVAGYFSAVALARGGPGRGSEGLMFVRFNENRARRVQDIVGGPTGIQARFFGQVEGAFGIAILPKAIGGGFSQNFQLVLQVANLETLYEVSQEILQKIRATGLIMNARATFELNRPQLQLSIDRERAARLGISVQEISRTLQILFGGQDLSQVKLEGEEYDVIVQLDRKSRLTPSQLEEVYVRSKQGDLVQLSNVVSSTIVAGPNTIQHYNRMRSVTIEGTPGAVPLGEVVSRTEELLEASLPKDVRYSWKGEAEDLKDSQKDSLFVLVLSIVVIYIVLAAQFEHLLHPLTVMLTLPLGAVGALVGLWVCAQVNGLGEAMYGWANYAPNPPWFASVLSAIVPRIPSMSINLFSLIGMLLLFGLVTKNAILLVDFANRELDRGATAVDAMIAAGRTRLRPILMTAFSTIFGMLPIAIGFGAGAESRRAMGIAIVFGMTSSTILTLFVVPLVYSIFAQYSGRGRTSETIQRDENEN